MKTARPAAPFLRAALALLLCLVATTPALGYGVTQADSGVFVLDLTNATASGTGGATTADSADFVLNTLPPGFAESDDFVLDLTAITLATTGGLTRADSGDFILDTTNVVASGTGGTTIADSADFVLNLTNAIASGIGGTTTADSADFVLNTLPPGFAESDDFVLDLAATTLAATGGTTRADSGDFILDTTGSEYDFVIRSLDIGLRAYDGTTVIKLGVERGTPSSPLRIRKNGVTYGIRLVPVDSPGASKIRVQTPGGVKAIQKLP